MLRSVRAVCAYEGAARSAVHAFKFRGGRHLAPLLGELLREHLARRPLRAELVVPVPLSPRRRKDRGYNQAQLLAEQIVESVGGTLSVDVLQRDDRPAQQTLGGEARLINLKGAIRSRERLHGQRVVLIDDVATTGATLSACAEALSSAGARDVRALVFARDL
jgi:ComF family protein